MRWKRRSEGERASSLTREEPARKGLRLLPAPVCCLPCAVMGVLLLRPAILWPQEPGPRTTALPAPWLSVTPNPVPQCLTAGVLRSYVRMQGKNTPSWVSATVSWRFFYLQPKAFPTDTRASWRWEKQGLRLKKTWLDPHLYYVSSILGLVIKWCELQFPDT